MHYDASRRDHTWNPPDSIFLGGFFCDNEVPMDTYRRMLRYRIGAPTFLNVWRDEPPVERSGLTEDVGQYDIQRPDWIFFLSLQKVSDWRDKVLNSHLRALRYGNKVQCLW